MVKKVVVILVFLVLGYLLDIIVTIILSLVQGNFIAGETGFPLKSSSVALFGGGSIYHPQNEINILFWTLIVFGTWLLIKKILKK